MNFKEFLRVMFIIVLPCVLGCTLAAICIALVTSKSTIVGIVVMSLFFIFGIYFMFCYIDWAYDQWFK